MPRSEEKSWGALGCLVAIACFLFAGPLIQEIENRQLALAGAGFVSSASFGLLAFSLGLLTRGQSPLGTRLGFARGALPAAALVFLCVGLLALGYAISAVLELAGLRSESSLELFDRTITGARGGALAALLLGIGIAPGFGEELLFRGFLQNGIQAKLGRVVSILVGALFFGLMHWDLAHGLGASVLGIYLGVVFVLDGSLRGPIVCHLANNCSVVLAVALTPAEQKMHFSAMPAILAAGIALVTLLSVAQFQKRSGSDPRPGDSNLLNS